MPNLRLADSIDNLKGVGPALRKRLRILNIAYIYQCLFYFPKRYYDYSTISPIDECTINTVVTVRGRVKKIRQRRAWKRSRLSVTEATLEDDTGTINAVWYNQPYIVEQLPVGTMVYLSGKATTNKYGTALQNPVYEKYSTETTHTARIVPYYPLTAGITQKQLRYYIKQALQLLKHNPEQLPDWLPQHIQESYSLVSLVEALTKIHFPNTPADLEQAKFRLGFDELLLVQLFILHTTQQNQHESAPKIPIVIDEVREFLKQLPFTLTTSQKQAAWEIIQDLAQSRPMNRLLEGDVGAGKTVVAALVMQAVAQAGYQSILMAPTEILAQQHYHTLCELLAHTTIHISLFTANHRVSNQSEESARITQNSDIIIGTHALIQKDVQFRNLALAVIDEQHRFGVAQRQTLKRHSGHPQLSHKLSPHLLSMTATPIPRSLALTIYGDLALSIIDTLPKNRKPIQTKLITTPDRKPMYKFIQSRLQAGEQVYVVAPRITDEPAYDDATEPQKTMMSVETQERVLHKQFPEARIMVLHGKLDAKTKQAVMAEFQGGKIDILIATTVIEVGVNVPNATIIVIEQADRFGLAQLHQLRGRVGRSNKQSYCFTCIEDDTSKTALQRLEYFTNTTNGFALAEYDLTLRGPGDVYGHSQSGFLDHFKIADLHNKPLVQATKNAAQELMPNIDTYPNLNKRLQHFIQAVHLE